MICGKMNAPVKQTAQIRKTESKVQRTQFVRFFLV